MESIKYILLLLGVFLTFFNDVLIKEKSENHKGFFKFKKLTLAGKSILIIGFVLSTFGIFQTYSDEHKTKKDFFNKSLQDSLKYANKLLSDSLNYVSILSKLSNTDKRIEYSKNEILTNTTNESFKQIKSIEQAKFPIPTYFYATFTAKILLTESELEQVKNLVLKNYSDRIQSFNRSPNLIKDFIALDNPVQNKLDLSLYNQLHNISNGIIFTELNIVNKSNVNLLSIDDCEKISLHKGRRGIIYNHNKEDYYSNYYDVYFDLKNNYVAIKGNKLELCSNKTNKISSLLEFANTKMKIKFSIMTFDGTRDIRNFAVDLVQLSLFTEEHLQITSTNFIKKSKNQFEKQLDDSPWK